MNVDVIEYLRSKMIFKALKHKSFTHPEVVNVSQRLDQFIVQSQRGDVSSQLNQEILQESTTEYLEKHFKMASYKSFVDESSSNSI